MVGELILSSARAAPHVTVGGGAWAGGVCHGCGHEALECLRNAGTMARHV